MINENGSNFKHMHAFQVDFLASFGGVTTAGETMMGSHLQGGPGGSRGLSVGSRLKQSWLDPNFSTSSDLSCTSVMVRGEFDLKCTYIHKFNVYTYIYIYTLNIIKVKYKFKYLTMVKKFNSPFDFANCSQTVLVNANSSV